MSLNMLNVS